MLINLTTDLKKHNPFKINIHKIINNLLLSLMLLSSLSTLFFMVYGNLSLYQTDTIWVYGKYKSYDSCNLNNISYHFLATSEKININTKQSKIKYIIYDTNKVLFDNYKNGTVVKYTFQSKNINKHQETYNAIVRISFLSIFVFGLMFVISIICVAMKN